MVARENPMISEIQNDEKEFKPAEKVPTVSTVSFNALRSHMGAPQSHQDIQTNGGAVIMTATTDCETSGDPNPDEEIMVDFTPWRSHLRAPHSHDVNNFTSANSANIYNNGRVASSPSTNHQSEFELDDALAAAEDDWNVDIKSVYARISKPGRMTTPTEHTPKEVQVTEIRGEESSPPLQERRLTTEG
ncbi:uncharacterized protein si:ch73-204p21.2 isoform X1 [Xyrichtys novacula]|nr:uncharacterized protein si:ch73-204p21.2 isoform X1 [Xyrichtys novacula]